MPQSVYKYQKVKVLISQLEMDQESKPYNKEFFWSNTFSNSPKMVAKMYFFEYFEFIKYAVN